MKHRQNLFVLITVAVAGGAGCGDKAKTDFSRCEQLEQARDYDEARKACELAVSKDPASSAGKLAAARLLVLATERRDDADQTEARISKVTAAAQNEKERLDGLKARFDEAAARQASIKARLDNATDPAEKTLLGTELAKAIADEAAATKEITSGSVKKGCTCAPNDPLCSCL
jgi:hypothetical protein